MVLRLESLLLWIAGISLLLAAAFSGVLTSGDRIRANYYSEQSSDRSFRLKATIVLLAVALVAGVLAWAASLEVM